MGNEASAPHAQGPQTGTAAAGTSGTTPPPATGAVPVTLHVYNLQGPATGAPTINQSLGFGFYHSGVEIFGYEIAFGGHPNAAPATSGVFALPPKMVLPPQQLHASHVLGHLPMDGTTGPRIQSVLTALSPQWAASPYHLLKHNCNHFSTALVDGLSKEFNVPMTVPSYVNRAARVGGTFCPDALYQAMMSRVPQPPQGNKPGGGFGSGTAGSAGARPSQAAGRPPAQNPASAQARSPPPASAATAPVPQASPAFSGALPDDAALSRMSVKELKALMTGRGISDAGCLEKADLIAAIHARR